MSLSTEMSASVAMSLCLSLSTLLVSLIYVALACTTGVLQGTHSVLIPLNAGC